MEGVQTGRFLNLSSKLPSCSDQSPIDDCKVWVTGTSNLRNTLSCFLGAVKSGGDN